MRALVMIILAVVGAAELSWHEHYRAGLEAFRSGDRAAARLHFESALAERPEPGLQVRTTGVESDDYMPHLYLAITAWHLGDADTARHHLELAEQAGVAEASPTGRALLDHYRALFAGPAPVPAATTARVAAPSIDLDALRTTRRAPEVLSEDEVRRIAQQTLVRCGLPIDTRPSSAPWYFHYELGRRLGSEGDPQRALDAFLEAADRKPLPDDRARMYGMWYVDYRPYLEIAARHVQLGNWQCAFSALELSRATGEIDDDAADEPAVRYLDLLEETLAHVSADEE